MSFRNALKRLVTGTRKPQHTSRRRGAMVSAIEPVVEQLEKRQLMTATFPTIGITGLGHTIPYQDHTLTTTDGTDFGSIDVRKNVLDTFVIANTAAVGQGTLNLTGFSKVQITGADAADFTVVAQPVASLAPGKNTSFKIKFQPTRAGIETATVQIDNDTDGANVFTYDIKGTGTAFSKAGLFGNSIAIPTGDVTTRTTDSTLFGNVESASGSVSKTFTIKNTGSGPLALTGSPKVAISGADAGAFSITTQPTGPVAVNGSATFVVKFQPGTAGTKNATLTIATDDPTASSYHFAIQGVAINAPVVSVQGAGNGIANGRSTTFTTDGTDFGSADLTSSFVTNTFTIYNTGASTMTFTGTSVVTLAGDGKTAFSVVAQPSATLAAGANETFQLKFAPGSVGQKNATVTLNTNDTNNAHFVFPVTGLAVSQPLLTLSGGSGPTALVAGQTTTGTPDGTDFGTIDIANTGITHAFQLKDTGSGTLHLLGSKITVSGTSAADFVVSSIPNNVPGIASVRVAAGRPIVTPTATKVKATKGVRHGGANVSTVNVPKITKSVASHPVVGTGNNTANFQVKFDPSTAIGAETAVVTVTTDDPTNPIFSFTVGGNSVSNQTLNVTGGGTNALAIGAGDVTPLVADGTDFGGLDETQTGTSTFLLTNAGSKTLNLTATSGAYGIVSGANAADFTVGTDAPATLAAGGTANVAVSFTPSATGLETATLTFTSDDPQNGTYAFALQGTGRQVGIAQIQGNGNTIVAGDTTPSSTDTTSFGNAEILNGFVNETFTVNNLGSGALNFTGSKVTVTGANHADFTVTTQPTGPVSAISGTNISAATFVVKFKPTTTTLGARVATVNVLSDDPATPTYSFAVKGIDVRQPTLGVTFSNQAITNGTAAATTLNGTDFGNADTAGSVDHIFTIKNNGSEALNLTGSPEVTFSGTSAADFSLVTRSRSSLAAGSTGTIDIRFSPSATGAENAVASIVSDDPTSPFVFNLTGTGVASPLMNVKGGIGDNTLVPNGQSTPRSLDGSDFGGAIVSTTSVSETFTINNTGGAALNLSGTPEVALSGANAGDFSVVAEPTTPVAGTNGASTFVINFSPTASGIRNATVTIASDDANTPYVFNIRGSGLTAPAMQVQEAGVTVVNGESTANTTDGTDFGTVEQANGFVTETFTVRNTGSAPLSLTGGTNAVVISGANLNDFKVTTQPSASIAASGSTTFALKFKPTAAGARNATVTIASNDTNTTPYTFAVTGTAVQQPVLSVLGANNTPLTNGQNALVIDGSDAGNVKVGGTPVTKTFTIKNTGSATMHLNGTPLVEVDGPDSADFVASTPAATTLAAGATTTFTVIFTPTNLAVENAVVTIASDDPNGAFSFNLKGTGTN